MSSESDFDIDDSDVESAENHQKATTKSPQKAKKRRRTKLSDDESNIGSDDSDQDDFEEEQKAVRKKSSNRGTSAPKQAAISKPTLKIKNSSGPDAQARSVPSSSSSSSFTSGSVGSNLVGGGTSGDITRGANITTESAAKKLILQYLRLQNRPYSAIQVFDNLHKRIAKPIVERCLATLSEPDGGLRCKEYGKAKIYFFDQKNMSEDLSVVRNDRHISTVFSSSETSCSLKCL